MSRQNIHTWENLVKKQLKTEDIYSILNKPNIEGLEVRAYYNTTSGGLKNLPKVEESTRLVSPYYEGMDENVFAVLLNENAENLEEKTVFVNSEALAGHIKIEDEDAYYALVDVFQEDGHVNEQLAKELLEKNFKRNICVDVALHQNSGAAIYQQLGLALAKIKDLTEIFGEGILSKIILKIAVGGTYFFEIAKIRALKLVFNQLSKEFGLDEIPYIFAETSLRNKAKNDEENNLIRSTLELAAAMIGGADAVFSSNYKIEKTNDLSSEISFKQQIILAYESIVNVFEDAANGSYFIEDLTQQIAKKSWKYFLELEQNGGYSANIKSGKIAKDIYDFAVQEQFWVDEGKIKLTGVNLYPKREATRKIEDLYSSETIKPVRLAEMFE